MRKPTIQRVPKWAWDTKPAKYVDDTTKPPQTKHFKAKRTKPIPMERVCLKCGNTCSDTGICDFCGEINQVKAYREAPQF